MISLPPCIMRSVAEYLPPSSRARMAQVSKAWRTIIYQDSPAYTLYQYRHQDLLLDHIPCDAEHLGERNTLCFLCWARDSDNVPRYVHTIPDPKTRLIALRKHWDAHGCPCAIPTHHRWTHLLKHRAYLSSIPRHEYERIYAMCVERRWRGGANVLVGWLNEQVAYLDSHVPYTSRVDDADGATHALTPLDAFRRATRSTTRERDKALRSQMEVLRTLLQTCASAMSRHSKYEFEANAKTCQSDEVWEAAAFSTRIHTPVGSSGDDDGAVSVHTTGDAPAPVNSVLVVENGLEPKNPV
jgi:hypothetical protein